MPPSDRTLEEEPREDVQEDLGLILLIGATVTVTFSFYESFSEVLLK
jgi:hypothetical protein